MKKYLSFILFITFSLSVFSQTPIEKGLASFDKKDAEKFIGILASDSLEGRAGGTTGGMKAADYLKSIFEEYGIKPWVKGYFQPFGIDNSRKTVSLDKAKIGSPQMRNILGTIRGKNANEVVIIGAHYDHLGVRKNRTNDSIYNGADDNASGVAGVLQVAKAFVASGQQPKRTIIFALWDGEEMGLLGSFYFTEDYYNNVQPPLLEPAQIKGYINLDMIGRDKNDTETTHVINYLSTDKPVFKEWVQSAISTYDLKLEPDFQGLENLPGGSDHMPFQMKGVPIIYYFTDLHKDYHKPSDHADKINYTKLTEISKISFLNLWNLANLDDY